MALTRATALWQGLDVADALSHAGAVSTGSVFDPWSKLCSSTHDGGPLGPLSQSGRPGSDATLGDTDFVAWALRVAPECGNLNLHTPVGTTLAIAFIMFSPERLISFQQAHSVMECCGLVEGPHEWSLTLSTTSRVPKPVYEALLGTLYADLVVKEGSDWKFPEMLTVMNHMVFASSSGEMPPEDTKTHDAEVKRQRGQLLLPLILPLRFLNIFHAFPLIHQVPPLVKSS